MDTQKTIGELNDLIQLDIDAVFAYEQALDNIDVVAVSEQIELFKQDHERHIVNLTDAVRALGGEPVEYKRDFKGFLIEGFTAIRSATGTEGALKAMKTNEETTNKKYEQALAVDMPEDIKVVVRSNREDERRHLEYIERALDLKVWEGPTIEEQPRP